MFDLRVFFLSIFARQETHPWIQRKEEKRELKEQGRKLPLEGMS